MKMEATLVDVVRARAERQGDEVWLRYLVTGEVTGPIVELTYAELARRSMAIAAELQQHGDPGDRAMLLFPSGIEFVTAFFGCLFAGMIPVPAYPPDLAKPERTLAKLFAITADCGASFAFTSAAFLPMLQGVMPASIRCLATDACEGGTWSEPSISSDTIAFVQYTSGSTGAPKGVVLRHHQLLANQRSMVERLGPVGNVFAWLPIFHDMGLIGKVMHTLFTGNSLVLMSPVAFLKRPARWLEAITHYRIVTSGAPNFAYDFCARRVTDAERARLDLASWQVAICGAEPVRVATYERFRAAFGPRGFSATAFLPCYGLAEATLFVTGKNHTEQPKSRAFDGAALDRGEVIEHGDRILMSCGVPSPTEEVRIVDQDLLVETTGVGEIWVRGPGVASGYWGRENERGVFDARLPDGEGPFLRTGDLGFLADGELYVAGRLKDMIILGGRNLFPNDIEATIEATVPTVRKGCCAAFSVEIDGEERLVIAAEHDDSPDADTVRAIKQAVAAGHQAAVFDVVLLAKGEIPKTSSGKLERHACRRAYQRRS